MTPLLHRTGRRLVTLLLRLYPRDFGRRWGDEMVEAFEVQSRAWVETRGRTTLPLLWGRTGWGMTKGALAEWARRKGTDDGRRRMSERYEGSAPALEVKHALRGLRRSPIFAALSVATIGVGVGAFSSVWAAVDGVLLEPLPYESPEELGWVWRDYTWMELSRGWLGGPDVAWMAEDEAVFEHVAAVRSGRLNLTGPAGLEPRETRVLLTSASLFDLLGVQPRVGRGFLPGEDRPGAPGVAVITHDLWVDAFGSDPDMIGRRLFLDGEAHEVVGILPRDFTFLMPASIGGPASGEIFLPLRMALAEQNPGAGFLAGLVRVRDGVPPDRVEAALAQVADRVDAEWGDRELRLWVAPAREDLVGRVRPALLAILAAGGFLLLVLAANLATLLMARVASRRRDAAVKVALGAGARTAATAPLLELAFVTAAGAALAASLTVPGTALVTAVAADVLPRGAEIGVDAGVVLVAVGVALGLGLLVAPVAVLGTARLRPGPALREAGGRSGGSRRSARGREAMVVVQVALSIVLLVGAGLLTRDLVRRVAQDPGFDPEATLTFRVALDDLGYPDGATPELLDGLREGLGRLPGVTAVGLGNTLPLTGAAGQGSAAFPDAPGNTGDADADQPLVDVFNADPGYFAATGLRLLEGETPDRPRPVVSSVIPSTGQGDAASPEPLPVVIDDVLARRFFPTGGAVGAAITVGDLVGRVVGVIDQARAYEVHRDDRGQVYLPLAADPPGTVTVALRTSGAPESLVAGARAAVRRVDPTVPVTEVRTLEAIVRDSLRDQRLNLTLVGTFATAALLLAGLGVYGVVSGTVVRRRPEIGVRMAMGARGGDVVAMVLLSGLRLVTLGALLGLAGSALASRFLETFLVGVPPLDPVTYLAAAGTLGIVAGVAGWLPARRATRVHPAEALRAE